MTIEIISIIIMPILLLLLSLFLNDDNKKDDNKNNNNNNNNAYTTTTAVTYSQIMVFICDKYYIIFKCPLILLTLIQPQQLSWCAAVLIVVRKPTPFLGFSVSYLGANPHLVFLKAYCVSIILMYDSLVLGGAFPRK